MVNACCVTNTFQARGKDMPKYSFMIPVYNKAEYLQKYFSRVQNQTFSDYEIVVIDDCSRNDNSYQYLLDLAKIDKRIKLFRNSQNLGIGLTRNELLKKANGQYVIFVDPDDYIEEELLEKIDEVIQEDKDLDIVRFQNISEAMTEKQVEIESRKNPFRFSCKPTDVISGEEALLRWMLGINKINTMPWTYCVKRSLYTNVEYPDTNILEDFAVTHYLISKAKKVKAIPFIGYHYLQYDDSLTKNYTSPEEELEFDRKKQLLFRSIIDLTKHYVGATDISQEAKVIFFQDIDDRYTYREERLAEKEKAMLWKRKK